MTYQLPTPIDTTPLLQEALRQRLALLQRPTGNEQLGKLIATAGSDIGSVVSDGINANKARNLEATKKKSVLDAQTAYSNYLAKIDSGSPLTDQDHQIGRMAGMALGIQPKEPPVKEDPVISDPAYLASAHLSIPTRLSAITAMKKGQPARVQIPQDQADALRAKFKMPASTDPMYTDQLGGLKLLGPDKPATPPGQGLQVDKFVQGMMDKVNTAIDPYNAKRGSAIGNAGFMKTRVATGLDSIQGNPTPQQIAAASNDLAGIVQQGAPQMLGIKDQNYNTWYTEAKALYGRISNSPQTADSPDTVAKLKDIFGRYDKVYNKVILSQVAIDKAGREGMFKKYPAFRSAYEAKESEIRNQFGETQDAQAAPATGATALPPANKNKLTDAINAL